MDDVLDVTQSTEVLGKPAGSDEAQNKNTFPKLMGLEASKTEAERLLSEANERLLVCQRPGDTGTFGVANTSSAQKVLEHCSSQYPDIPPLCLASLKQAFSD